MGTATPLLGANEPPDDACQYDRATALAVVVGILLEARQKQQEAKEASGNAANVAPDAEEKKRAA